MLSALAMAMASSSSVQATPLWAVSALEPPLPFVIFAVPASSLLGNATVEDPSGALAASPPSPSRLIMTAACISMSNAACSCACAFISAPKGATPRRYTMRLSALGSFLPPSLWCFFFPILRSPPSTPLLFSCRPAVSAASSVAKTPLTPPPSTGITVTCRSLICTSAMCLTPSDAYTTLLAPEGGSSHTRCPVLCDSKYDRKARGAPGSSTRPPVGTE
mmetsp:Transcript_3901/g.10720  ORF Transcript_3901/g.10720 Transcript_3901/m.10720 type:complete len:219 (-) Transcript_3901:7-663(-)